MSAEHRLTEDEKKRLYRALTRNDRRGWRRWYLTGYSAAKVIETVDRLLAKREATW